MAERKPRAKKAPVAAKPAAAAPVKGPATRSGTLSASDIKGSTNPEPVVRVTATQVGTVDDGPGLVEHGVGLGRHRVEDGPVPAEGTVILVAPERG